MKKNKNTNTKNTKKPLFSIGEKVFVPDSLGKKVKTTILDILPLNTGRDVLFFYVVDHDEKPFVAEESIEPAE